MSIYIDTLTVVAALYLLFVYCRWFFQTKTAKILVGIGILLITSYLVAQSGWTVAYFAGDTWGRDFYNYIWFIHNSAAQLLLFVIWYFLRETT